MSEFGGLGMYLGNLSRICNAQTRSICAENLTGEKGGAAKATEGTGASHARDLGQGWKISPSIVVVPGEDRVLAEIEGMGALQSMWLSGDIARLGARARSSSYGSIGTTRNSRP